MDSDPAALDRIPPLAPLTPESTIDEAGAHMRATCERMAVVTRGGCPIAVLSAAAVADAVQAGASDAPVMSIIDYVVVPVAHGAEAGEVLHSFSRAAWEWLRATRPAPYRNGREPITS
jgi:hypothetical protein